MIVSETGIFTVYANLLKYTGYSIKAGSEETKPYYFKSLSNLFLNTVWF